MITIVVSMLYHTNVDAWNSLMSEKKQLYFANEIHQTGVEGQPKCLPGIFNHKWAWPLWWVGLVLTHGSPLARYSLILLKPFSSSAFGCFQSNKK